MSLNTFEHNTNQICLLVKESPTIIHHNSAVISPSEYPSQVVLGENLTASPLLSRKNGQHGSKLASKIDQKSIKNRCKNRTKIWCILGLIFGRIWKDFGSPNGAMLAPKSIKNRCKNRSFFWCLLGLIYERNLVDFWFQNGAKLLPKWDQESMLNSKGDFW